jgi:apolipoprotein N-acyltransferase
MLTSARVLGGDGLTLLTALLGGLAWTTVWSLRRAWQVSETHAEGSLSPGAARLVRTFDEVRPVVLGTIAVAALGTLVTIGPPPEVGQVEVLVVQGSDGVPRARGLEEDLRIARSHLDETRRAITADGVPDLTVWAENAVDTDPDGAGAAVLQPLLASAGAVTEGRLLTGLTRDGPTAGTFRNQVVRITEEGDLGTAYDKIEIVPFGEYVPFRSLIGDIGPLRRVPRDAIAGTGPVTIEVGGVRVAPLICFETLFPGLVRAAVAHEDAGLVVAVTNDASFGEPAASAQHLAQSRLRAVETGRAVVHASIAGASALVLPDGSLQAQAPLFEVASIRATVPVVSGSTPAASVAPVVSGLLAAALVGLLLWRVGQLVVARRTTG